MSKDASRELVAEMAGVYREAEAARLANFHQRNGEAHLRHNPICAGQPVWTLHLEPVTRENALNHPGYVALAGRDDFFRFLQRAIDRQGLPPLVGTANRYGREPRFDRL